VASNTDTSLAVIKNIVNVFARFSDEHFIRSNWNTAQPCSLVYSCGEGIELLHSFFFFDVSQKSDHGLWKDDLAAMPEKLVKLLVNLSKTIDRFADYELHKELLLKNKEWKEIMMLCSNAKYELEQFYNLQEKDYLL
jgi:hypothetical protein